MVSIKEIHEEEGSSSPISDPAYEVFLSFRGEDTRLNFTDHLYHTLIQADINTFLDDESMETGDDLKPGLETAIRQSRAAIIVLSKNYASSRWCLNELVMILERRRNFGMIVLPIFYNVDPSHVRKQEDSFAEGLRKHEKAIEAEIDLQKKQEMTDKMKKWKDALTEVANMKGKDVKGLHETTVLNQIVTEIDRRLDRRVSAAVTSRHLIGRSWQIQLIEWWLQNGSTNNVDFLTICGMGGIGKTSLAQYIYEKNFQLFERSCFLENVGNASHVDMLNLQKQLLKKLKVKRDISRVSEGTTLIEKALTNKRVLLVLDDVNKVDQLNALLGRKGLCRGSKIIITTRDKSLPKQCELWNIQDSSKSYKEELLKGLATDESLELLNRHAFRCNSPKEGYEELSTRAVKYCEGHPLALKVLGSSLFQRDIATWEETLELLEKESNSDIESVLRISFDSLKNQNDKTLFKYIACIFVGKDTDYIGKVLKRCGIGTLSGIQNLNDRCLLTVDSSNCVAMHQLLQEMARHMIHQESPAKPWKHSILCCHEDSFYVLKETKGTENNQGLILDMQILEQNKSHGYDSAMEENFENDPEKDSRTFTPPGWIRTFISRFWWLIGWFVLLFSTVYPEEGSLRTEAFTKMKNLALLQLNFVQLTGSYDKLPKRLRWLCWHGFHSQYIPPELPMANIVALDMSHSNLEQLWTRPKSLPFLKILDLSDCVKLIRTGDLSGLGNLERLILVRCSSLVEICESIGEELRALALLDLRYCVKLRMLPRNMNKLRKMKTLLLKGCLNLFEMKTTEVVPRNQPSTWVLLPHSIVKLSLARNDLYSDSFPKDFSSLSSLIKLDLSENPMDSLPDCVRTLNRVGLLRLVYCKNLKSALDLPSSIRTVNVTGCKSLEKLTFHPSYYDDLSLKTGGCEKLTEVQGFFKSEPIEKVGKEVTKRLGWSGFGFQEQQEVITNNYTLPSPLMLYDYRQFTSIFCTYFLGNQVPDWFTYKSSEPSVSFTVPQSPDNLKIRGLNVCFVQTIFSDSIIDYAFPITRINNMTTNIIWAYRMSKQLAVNSIELYLKNMRMEEHKKDIIWVSHRVFENNEFMEGDDVCVSIEEDENKQINIKGCGINLVYDEYKNELQEKESDPLDDYKSWNYMFNNGILYYFISIGLDDED